MTQKSPEAFRSIGEVASLVGVAPHVLRYWEAQFSQLAPVKRADGRRYYRPEDVKLVAGLCQVLREEGLSIRGAKRLIAADRGASLRDIGALRLEHILADEDSAAMPRVVQLALPDDPAPMTLKPEVAHAPAAMALSQGQPAPRPQPAPHQLAPHQPAAKPATAPAARAPSPTPATADLSLEIPDSSIAPNPAAAPSPEAWLAQLVAISDALRGHRPLGKSLSEQGKTILAALRAAK